MQIENFTSKSNKIAVIGASSNPDKWGYRIYKKLKNAGFSVFPVNPKGDSIDGKKSFRNLEDLPERPDMAITVVPPEITEDIVRKCNDMGIKSIWMQPGSESEEAIKYCEDNGMEVIHHACFVVDGLHDNF